MGSRADSLDSERFGDGSNLGDEQTRLFPSAEVSASLGLTPVHDRWEPGFRPSAVGAWYLLWKTVHPVGTVTLSPPGLVNQAVTSAMLSQYSRADEAPVRVSQYNVMLSNT